MAEARVTLTGNLTADPESRVTAAGVPVASFRVASTPRHRDASGEWKDGESLFLGCTAWRQTAEAVARTLHRGDRVLVTGRLRQRSFETREGEKRTVIEVEVEEVGAAPLAAQSPKPERRPEVATEDPWATAEVPDAPF